MECHICGTDNNISECSHYNKSKGKDMTFVEYLKEEGFKPHEIRYAISIQDYGVTMTKAIYEFERLYNEGEIDGFPDSSIEVLLKIYGTKRVSRMSQKTIFNKIYTLQRCITDSPDESEIKTTIDYYLDYQQQHFKNNTSK